VGRHHTGLLTIVLVSSGGPTGVLDPVARRRALPLAAVSGVFIGAFLIAFERAGTGQGLVPLFAARALSLPLLVLVALGLRRTLWPAGVSPRAALASGVFDISANALYLLALAGAPLSIVATLSNLYTAWTVLIGVVFLRDRPRPLQQLGLVLALRAIVLITLSPADSWRPRARRREWPQMRASATERTGTDHSLGPFGLAGRERPQMRPVAASEPRAP
jgi:hypothetical protein